MSQQIARLEKELGVQLFDRRARGTVLTDAGRALLPLATNVLSSLGQFEEQARSLARGTSGRLRIGSPSYAVRSRARQRIVASFHRRHPDVELSFANAWSPQLLEALQAGSLDLSFAMLAPAESGLDYLCVEDEPATMLMPVGHPLAHTEVVSLADLTGHQVLIYPPSINGWLYDRMGAPLRQVGAVVKGLQEASLPAVIEQVRTGHGVFPAVPWEMDFVNVESLNGLVVRPTSGEVGLRYQLWLARRAGDTSPAVTALWNSAQDSALTTD